MDAVGYLVNGLISPITWVPAFAVALGLRAQPWYIRIVAAACATLVVGLGFALFVTPGNPGNLWVLVCSVLAAMIWSAVASLVVFGNWSNSRD